MKLQAPIAMLAVLVIGLGLYVVLSRPSSPRKTGGMVIDYDRYDYRRSKEARTVHIGNIPTGVSSIFSVQGLFHDQVLQEQLAARGWSLRAFDYRSGKDVLPYADGRLDVMTMGDTEALMAVQRRNVGIFAAVRQGSNAIIASHRVIPAELKGLRIGYTHGTILHYALERALVAAGLTMGDITPVSMPPDEMEAALRDGRVDAVATLEPFISIILAHVPGSAAIASSDSYTYLLADLDFAERHPEVLKALLAAVVRAARWGRQSDDNLRIALGWIRQANLQFSGESRVEPTATWLGVLHRETIDNASFPMLPSNARQDLSLQHRQFEYLKKGGFLPAEAEWRQIRDGFHMEMLPEIIRRGQAWQIDHFRYAPNRLYLDGRGQP